MEDCEDGVRHRQIHIVGGGGGGGASISAAGKTWRRRWPVPHEKWVHFKTALTRDLICGSMLFVKKVNPNFYLAAATCVTVFIGCHGSGKSAPSQLSFNALKALLIIHLNGKRSSN
ncbi:uncharacterized protein [Physcomitrium patens]